MAEIYQSTLFWGALIVFVVVLTWALERLFGGMVNEASEEREHYPHRVANELPRVLHKNDHDEVVELKDQTELTR